MTKYNFLEYNKIILIGVVSGLLSGLFFALYDNLKSQIHNFWLLAGWIIFIVVLYYIFVSFALHPLLYYWDYLIEKQEKAKKKKR